MSLGIGAIPSNEQMPMQLYEEHEESEKHATKGKINLLQPLQNK